MRERDETPAADRGPGAHSGAEQPARRRTVPGTASAAEGYRPDEGTAGGEPLEGESADPRDRSADQAEATHPDADADADPDADADAATDADARDEDLGGPQPPVTES